MVLKTNATAKLNLFLHPPQTNPPPGLLFKQIKYFTKICAEYKGLCGILCVLTKKRHVCLIKEIIRDYGKHMFNPPPPALA